MFNLLKSLSLEPILLLKSRNKLSIVLYIFELLLHASHLLMQSLVDLLVPLTLQTNFLKLVLKAIDFID
jgi:hypothetical protein